ncbi:MAG: glycosyltransferase [Arenicella sp.]|nr:glycosyltransferase [Arenicella sp.]
MITGYKQGVPFAPHNYIFFNPNYRVSRILDFGHGVGRNFPALQKLCDELVGYDIPEMNAAYRRLSDSQEITLIDNWQLVHEQHFDVVVANLVFQHMSNEDTLNYFLKGIADICDYLYVSTRSWRDGPEQQNIAQTITSTGLFSFERGSVEENTAVAATPASEAHFELLFRSKKAENWRKQNSIAFNLPHSSNMPNQDLKTISWKRSNTLTRIVIIESGLNIGGAEWFSTLLTKHLDSKKFEVIFFCYDTNRSKLRPYLETLGVNVVSVHDFSRVIPSFDEWMNGTLFEMLGVAKPDIILFPTQLLYDRLPKDKLSKYKFMVRISTFFPQKMQKYDFNYASRVMCCSVEQHDDLSPVWGEKATLAPTGVDMLQFQFSESKKRQARQELGIQSENVVLFVGRLGAPKKRLWLFQKIVERIKLERQDVTFLVAGYFYHYQESEKEAFLNYSKNEPIVWVDDIPPWDMQKYYSAADTLVSTSDITEGLSNTALQALASGVIPVTSLSSGMAELVIHGENGFIVDSVNPSKFSEAICGVLDMPEGDRLAMQQSGRQHILENFNLSDTVNQYQQVICEIMQE